jgi:hypothetical protein
VHFNWQSSEDDHYSACLSHGLFHVQNSGKLGWVAVTGSIATFTPAIQDVYPSASYLSLHYGGETLLLKISPYILYEIPAPRINPDYPLIKTIFADVEEGWLLSGSTFRFSDNLYDVNPNQ